MTNAFWASYIVYIHNQKTVVKGSALLWADKRMCQSWQSFDLHEWIIIQVKIYSLTLEC